MAGKLSEALDSLRQLDVYRLFLVAAVTAAAVVSPGCEFQGREPTVEETPERTTLPPNDLEALAQIYDHRLAEFGLRLTRGSLIDLSNDSYTVSDTGTHLALYVEPTGDYPTELYLENLVPVTAVFAPGVFERWPGLESFDVCQEPPSSVDADDEPEPDTQVNVTREQSDALDWDSLDNADLLAAALREPPEAKLIISERIRELDEYDELLAEVERRTGLTPD